MRSIVTCCLVLSLASTSAAGFYSPYEPTDFPIQPDGAAEALPFGTQDAGRFRVLLLTRLNEIDANPLRSRNPDRRAALDRLAALPHPRTKAEILAKSADLLRVGQVDGALELLSSLRRDPRAGFVAQMNLAHVHATRGEWREAMPIHNEAVLEGVPNDLPGTTPAQRKWLEQVERVYYSRWLAIHSERALDRGSPMNETIFPLFPGVTFVNDAGKYEAGAMNAASRTKLPPDAVAITQQLVLWAPWDTSLYWLLGELYAAKGQLREAQIIFNQCADGRQFSNRTLFREHRLAILAAVEKLGPEQTFADVPLPPLDPPAPSTAPVESKAAPEGDGDAKDAAALLPPLSRMIPVAILFTLIVLALVVLQIRAIRRRLRSGSRASR